MNTFVEKNYSAFADIALGFFFCDTFKRIVHELKFFRFLKIPSYKSNLL